MFRNKLRKNETFKHKLLIRKESNMKVPFEQVNINITTKIYFE